METQRTPFGIVSQVSLLLVLHEICVVCGSILFTSTSNLTSIVSIMDSKFTSITSPNYLLRKIVNNEKSEPANIQISERKIR